MDSTANLRLEAHRRKAGVSLETIADKTKISSRFLRAIECEEYEKLPGGIFDTNYIRQYAASIGYPEEVILQNYHARNQSSQIEPEPEQVKPQSRIRSVFNWLLGPVSTAKLTSFTLK